MKKKSFFDLQPMLIVISMVMAFSAALLIDSGEAQNNLFHIVLGCYAFFMAVGMGAVWLLNIAKVFMPGDLL